MAITVTTGTLPTAISEALSDKPTKMYIYMEFANTTSNIPTSFTVAENIPNFANPNTYYLTTIPQNGRNFIRVPAVRNPVVEVVINSTSGTSTTVYMAQSIPGQNGVHSSTAVDFGTGSICYGAALVLAKDDVDITNDIVLARSYFTNSSERLVKTGASELFVTFPLVVSSGIGTSTGGG